MKKRIQLSFPLVAQLHTDCKYVVDMSSIDEKVFSNKYHQFLVYSRNLELCNYDIMLDFSKCSYIDKEKYICEYLSSEIYCNIDEFNFAIYQLLSNALGKKQTITMQNEFFTMQDICAFNEKNNIIIEKLLCFYKSLQLYIANLHNSKFTVSFKHACNNYFSNNAINAYKYVNQLEFEIYSCNSDTCMFNNVFQRNNDKLIIALQNSILLTILVHYQTEKWNMFVGLLNQYMRTNQCQVFT